MTFVLPKKTQILWQIRSVFAFSFLPVIFTFMGYLVLPLWIIAAIGLIFSLIYIPFYFKSYKITVDDNSIIVTKGIVFKMTNIMPYPRLIFAQSVSTPVSSMMKMKCVMLKAARGWMLIPEIENDNADYMLQNLRIRKNELKNF